MVTAPESRALTLVDCAPELLNALKGMIFAIVVLIALALGALL